MDCRILRQLMLKADGHLVCDDSNGYFINLGVVSTTRGWSVAQVLTGAAYSHIRTSFEEGRIPWRDICDSCDLFSKDGIARDTLDRRIRIMIEPTLSCRLGCPTCKRGLEAGRRSGDWDLDPTLFQSLLQSCATQHIEVEEIQYLGWGEPLLHPAFDRLTQIARDYAPNACQEVTTTGNIDFHDGLPAAQIDRIVVSCDGVRQDAYEQFRRNGRLSDVFDFMRDAKQRFHSRPFVEWKYIVFSHNDSDAELVEAQALADQFAVDSLLFILTNSKNRSRRFDVDNIDDFPLRSNIASVVPAAARMKTSRSGALIPEGSALGDRPLATLFLDRCSITESDMAVLEGWTLDADKSYVESIDVIVGNQVRTRARTIHRRSDVVASRPDVEGPDCGFVLRFPLKRTVEEETFLFVVRTRAGDETFRAHIAFR
ncbi:hypothetical+protein [Methylocapsa aurea]|uniref:radical SAM protein n=1 Tax=Methylocapsa aurea TaxID=663610 RepID=UPI003D188DE2